MAKGAERQGWVGSAAPCRTGRDGSFAELKERQLVFLLVRQLADAQFVRADRSLTQRLWQEVAALEIDPDRIAALLYGGHDPEDRLALEQLDCDYRRRLDARPPARRAFRWSWGSRAVRPRVHAGGRRTSPAAVPPARRAAG